MCGEGITNQEKKMVEFTQYEWMVLWVSIYFAGVAFSGLFHVCYRHEKHYREDPIFNSCHEVCCEVYCCSAILAFIWPIHLAWIFIYSFVCWPIRCCSARRCHPCIRERVYNPLTCDGEDGSCSDCLCPKV